MLNTIDIDEFTRLAGLDLNAEQTADLRGMLDLHPESGKWRCPTWVVTNLRTAPELLAARALIGLLVLDENILWTAPGRPELRDAFQRLVHSVSQMGTANGPSEFGLGNGVTVKVRRANGEERLERAETGKRIRFACRRYPGAGRGYVSDLLIVDDARKFTDDQRADLMPTMVSRPNPQIIYA